MTRLLHHTEVGGIFSVYCVNFNQNDHSPDDQILCYVVKDNKQKKAALERLEPSFECHGGDNFRAFIYKADDENLKCAMEVKPNKMGNLKVIAA